MNDQLQQSFVKAYSDKRYKHTTIVNHRGTLIAFAMDATRQIHYTVLDVGQDEATKGPLDVKYWEDNPKPLTLPDEIERVGFGVVNAVAMPQVQASSLVEITNRTLAANETDNFRSTTARLSADAPFQVLSDNRHVYLFRQAIAASHADMVHRLKAGGTSGTATDRALYLPAGTGPKQPIVDATLLVDRFILTGTTLKLPREVRFRRSENRTTPASATDSLGATSMEGQPFSEPTKELDFVGNLTNGGFSVLLLPSEVADLERWQIFANNAKTAAVDSFNIERAADGFFNTQGTTLYTSPDEQYRSSVLERKPGTCPFTRRPLVPVTSTSGSSEWAADFSGTGHVSIPNNAALQVTGDQTIEMWVRPTNLASQQSLIDKDWRAELSLSVNANGRLVYYFSAAGSADGASEGLSSTSSVAPNTWTHVAVVRKMGTGGAMTLYINGVAAGQQATSATASKLSTSPLLIGDGYYAAFEGQIDEVRFWNRARSGPEIVESLHHRLIGNEPGLAGYWRLDEGSGTAFRDQTDNANNGQPTGGTIGWVASDAPIGEHPGTRRSSFAFQGREVTSGLSAKLFYEQETVQAEGSTGTVKQNARVLVAAATSGPNPDASPHIDGTKTYVAALDLAVSRHGRLALIPDAVPVPVIRPPQVGGSSAATLAAIADLQGQIGTLTGEIDTLDGEIRTLDDEIAALQGDVDRLPTLRQDKQNLQNQLAGTATGQPNVVFYVGSQTVSVQLGPSPLADNKGGDVTATYSTTGPETSVSMGSWLSKVGRIEWVEFSSGNIEVATRSVSALSTRNRLTYSSTGKNYVPYDTTALFNAATIREKQSVKDNRARLNLDISAKTSEIEALEAKQRGNLSPKQTLVAQKRNQRTGKQNDLQTKQTQLAVLKAVGASTASRPPQPLTRFHTDLQGLTASSGLLEFAITDAQPTLFESALGRLSLYFKGLANEFYATSYETKTSRARWQLPAGQGTTLSLVSHSSEPDLNATSITVAAGSDADHCGVTIANTTTGMTETWTDVPRAAADFARVLNGDAGDRVYLGKLKTALDGTTAATSVELESAAADRVPARSQLVIEDRSGTATRSVILTSTTGAAGGATAVSVTSTTEAIAAGSRIYAVAFDYASRATVNQAGYRLTNGSLTLSVEPGGATGTIGDTAVSTPTAQAVSPRWVADSPGTALSFDGTSSHLIGQTPADFAHGGDLTMEAWVQPQASDGDARVVHSRVGGAEYSLGLRSAPVNSALQFTGTEYINLGNRPELQITGDLTIEMWIKPDAIPASGRQSPFSKAYGGEGAITLESNGLLSYYFGTAGAMAQPYYSVTSTEPLVGGQWSHIAVVRDLSNGEITWYINGQPKGIYTADVSSTTLPAAATASNLNLQLGHGYAGGFRGAIDEVRIWNLARSTTDIRADRLRRLGGQETGLAAYYHFDQMQLIDRSGGGHHGVQMESWSGVTQVASPLGGHKCFATVTSGSTTTALISTEAQSGGNWQHLAAVHNKSYALRFDGNDFGDAGNETMLDITGDLTIEAVVNLDSLGQRHGIVSKGIMDNGDTSTVPYSFWIDESGKLVLSFEDQTGTNHTYRSNGSVAANTVSQVAVVRHVGSEKIEKTGTQQVTYTDENGTDQTQTFTTIESIDFKDHADIRFYINGTQRGLYRHQGRTPGGNNDPLYLGRSYLDGQTRAQLRGSISELRIWNAARAATEIGKRIQGAENGLVAWWRLEEGAGNVATDSRSGNDARLVGTSWIDNPDPNASSFIIYRDGQKESVTPVAAPASGHDGQFTIGAKQTGATTYGDFYKGAIDEVRIWKRARREEEILDNMFTRLKGGATDLIANYTFEDIRPGQTGAPATVLSAGLGGRNVIEPTTPAQRPTILVSTAPVSDDAAQVRPVLSGVKTAFHSQISDRVGVAEYADTQRNEDGAIVGVFKRAYSSTRDGRWLLTTGYKVGNLVTEWLGQAQFAPQVIGYIEGAPPVPSENLTEGVLRTTQTFNGISSVSVDEAESVSFTVSTSKEDGFLTGFEAEAEAGFSLDPRIILAPMGVGMSKKVKLSLTGTYKLGMEANGTWTSGETYKTGQNISRTMAARLNGSWDVNDRTKWRNSALPRRFIPANTGFAFVESSTADIYALRLEHTGALVAFRMLPNPDIPPDTNIIPFPINPRYTKQGTLDGKIGFTGNGVVVTDADYPQASEYGEYSYYKPKEAYELKKRVEREEQALRDFYTSFDTDPAGARLLGGLAGGIAGGAGGTGIIGAAAAAKLGATIGLGPAAAGILSAAMIAGGMGGTIGSLIDAGNFDNELGEKFARRNIVNTYVWTADGGFYAEQTQVSQVRSTSSSGAYKLTGKGTGGFKLELESFAKSKFGLNGMLGGSLNISKSKSEEASESFSLSMQLQVPDNLQQYQYGTGGVTGGVTPVYDQATGEPVRQPGKVDAYRFMTFSIEPSMDNFEDLFGKVIDPIWLEESTHPSAMALREANQASKKPKCWRVFHRVTFVSRILPDFAPNSGPPLLRKMKDLNIASNYELVRRLDPFVRDQTSSFAAFSDAVRSAVAHYMPALSGDTELSQITLFLADYYGVAQ